MRVDVFSPTSCVDLVPTFLYGISQSIPDWCEGQVLPIFDENNAGISDRSIYAIEAKGNPKNAPLTMATVSLIKGTHKIISYKGYEGLEDKYEVYDLERDSEEMEDIYQTGSIVGKQLKDELDQKLSEVNQNIGRSNK